MDIEQYNIIAITDYNEETEHQAYLFSIDAQLPLVKIIDFEDLQQNLEGLLSLTILDPKGYLKDEIADYPFDWNKTGKILYITKGSSKKPLEVVQDFVFVREIDSFEKYEEVAAEYRRSKNTNTYTKFRFVNR